MLILQYIFLAMRLLFRRNFCLLLATFSLLTQLSMDSAQAEYGDLSSPGNKFVNASLVVDRESIQPVPELDQSVAMIGVNFQIEPGWHIYWRNSGEAALPTTVTWDLPDGWEADHLNWPVPEKFVEQGDITTFGYSDQVMLFSSLRTNDDLEGELIVRAEVKWLVCKNICVPGRTKLERSIKVSSSDALTASADFELFKQAKKLVPESVLAPEKFEAVKVDGKFYQRLALTGASLQGVSEKDFQYFPYSADSLSEQLAKYSENPAALYFPQAKDSIEGVLVISPDAQEILGLPAQSEIKIDSKNALAHASAISFDSEPKPLTLRLNHYKDKNKDPDSSKVAGKPKALNDEGNPLPAPLKPGLFSALGFALLGGILLNFMPCVLPVLSIKAFSLVEKSEKPKSSRVSSALAYLIGIELAFLTLAGCVLLLRNLGNQVGWGFQFQNPGFLVALIVIVFSLALSFFGVYKISFSLPGKGFSDSGGDGFLGDVFDGILITVLSTPCTAPFLGTALAFAFAAPGYGVLFIFAVIGLGLALPFILLSFSDSCQSLLPSPGAWMNSFKQLMGFFLIATVVWLISVYQTVAPQGVTSLLMVLFVVALLLWCLSLSSISQWWGKLLTFLVFVLAVAFSIQRWPTMVSTAEAGGSLSSSEIIDWKKYSPQALSDAQSKSQPVFIDFTAQWCVTCKANEKFVIETETIAKVLAQNKFFSLIADWTTADPEVSAALKKYGGTGVPHYVVLDRSGKVSSILGSVVTVEELAQALKRAAG